MAYIGKQPIVGNFVKLDAITTSATTTFNLTNGGVAYYPQSANNCIVSLNGVIQSPTSAYTISGSTIVFSDALTTNDVIDFIIVLGDVLNIGTPSDNTVSLAKLTATGTKDSTTFLRGDNTFATPSGGKVLQVVNQFYDTQTSINGTSFTDTGMTASITPSSSSNKVLVMFYPSFSTESGAYPAFKLFRGATEIGSSTNTGTGVECFTGFYGHSTFNYSVISLPIVYLDSPATTSSTTYKLQVSPMRTSALQFYLNRSHTLGDDNQYRTVSNVILMEIAN